MANLTNSSINRQNILNNKVAIIEIQKDLLLRIITSILNEIDNNEELKLEIFDAIS